MGISRQKPGGSALPGNTVRFFTLIEVVLGLAVIAFGLISVVALFPVGLQATRDSMAQSYAADNADEMLHVIALQFKNRTTWTGVETTLPTSKPGETEPQGDEWGSSWREEDTATIWRAGSQDEFMRFEQRTKDRDQADFTAIGRLWLTPVERWDDDGDSGELSYASGVRINFEISWPGQLPYKHRRKSLYQLDVFNPKPPAL